MCEAADKKTIAPDHVLEALKMLGFHEMVPECEKVLIDCKEENAKRKKPNKLSNSGLSEEELYRFEILIVSHVLFSYLDNKKHLSTRRKIIS